MTNGGPTRDPAAVSASRIRRYRRELAALLLALVVLVLLGAAGYFFWLMSVSPF